MSTDKDYRPDEDRTIDPVVAPTPGAAADAG